jgi:myo-inositol-1(or 4)-monophosphatase
MAVGETADAPAQRAGDLNWIVDRSTARDFIRGRKGWAVSVALVSCGRPLLAALCARARRILAGRGWPRRHAQRRAAGRLHRTRRRARACPRCNWRAKMPIWSPPDQPSSIALRMAMVAANEADLVATLRWGNEWDIAAAAPHRPRGRGRRERRLRRKAQL